MKNNYIFKVFYTEMGTVLLAWFFPKATENPLRSVQCTILRIMSRNY